MNKKEISFLAAVLIITFILIYYPHFTNPYPLHIDEYNHITEAIKLQQGNFALSISSLELGFRIFLIFIIFFTDIVLFYRYLPAIWALLSALALFYVIKKKTYNYFQENESFFIAIFAMIFFASIKSNVNIMGLWFFTPMTFSIPFVFLYIYFFSEGIEKDNNKLIFFSFLIMTFVLITHAPSVLFAIPILIAYSVINYKKIKQNYKILSLFILLPIIGIIFYTIITKTPLNIINILSALQFKKGWGVAEFNNYPLELYSLIGYILAIIGLIITFKKENIKKYLIYLLWPIILIISILIFRFYNVSFFSPYQRNLYYFALSLPFFSSLGLFYLLKSLKTIIKKELPCKIISFLLITSIIFLAFYSYFSLPQNSQLYETINKDDYKAIKFLSASENGTVLAPVLISDAVFPIAKKQTVGTAYFSGNRAEVDLFFIADNCNIKNQIIKKNNVKYILSPDKINCNWTLIYDNEVFVYKINN